MNSSIELMVKEHEDINRMNLVVRNICLEIMRGAEIPVEDFRNIIDFIRNYADKHHHGKEEKYLFPKMIERMGTVADNLVTHGMLVEHDLGRGHIHALETAINEYEKRETPELRLDIITEAMGYAHLLQLHIEKENSVVYPFAERSLSSEDFAYVNENSEAFESGQTEKGVQEKYLSFLAKMEEKYKRA